MPVLCRIAYLMATADQQLSAFVQGYGYPPEELIPVGSLPALQELHLSDMLEGDAGLYADPRSRFHMPQSLGNLQVRHRDASA